MRGTRLLVFVLLGVILFLCGVFTGHDWTLYFMKIADLQNPELYSRFMKFPVTFICMLLTWLIMGSGVSARDTWKLRTAYSLIVLGDIIFFFDVHSVVGVYSFALAHLVLIVRNAAGLGGFPRKGRLWILLALIMGGSLALMFLVFYPMLKGNMPYFNLLLGYAVIVSASLWAALAAFRIGYFPRGNAVLIAAGVACFFLSDVCVGLYRALPRDYDMVFATYATWWFYAPALTLTALSGYDLKKISG